MDVPSGPALLAWLETSALGVAMREWAWLYPIVEIHHILGFVVLVSGMARHPLWWARGSFLVIVPW